MTIYFEDLGSEVANAAHLFLQANKTHNPGKHFRSETQDYLATTLFLAGRFMDARMQAAVFLSKLDWDTVWLAQKRLGCFSHDTLLAVSTLLIVGGRYSARRDK